MRVPQLGGDVEAEVLAVLDGAVAQFDAHGAALLEGLLQQQRLQHRVQLLRFTPQTHGVKGARAQRQIITPMRSFICLHD